METRTESSHLEEHHASDGVQAARMVVGEIPDRLFFRIGDVAQLVGVKPYVLRYWESEFPIISPEKSGSGQRVYRKSDVETLLLIKFLLYNERYSIEGARRRIKELRSDGELQSFKRKKVLGGEDQIMKQERHKKIEQAISELRQAVKVPLHEIFKL